jgi:ABC-type Mn2+/Zn2+ transport system ATPase subunit
VNGWALELQDIVVTRGKRRILRVPQLRVAARDFLGIVGPNGAGKTTLLRLCASLLHPDVGRITILGKDPQAASAWAQSGIRRSIGYLHQSIEHRQDLPFTLEQVVSMGLYGRRGLLRRLTNRDQEQVAFWIDRLGLNAMCKRAFRSLSGGEQRKALIARAMIQDPRLLLLDEPGANLDLDWKEQLIQLIEALFNSLDMAVVMVSHETWQLPQACRRVALMKDGEIVRIGPKRETLSGKALSQLFGCRVESVLRSGRVHALSEPHEGRQDAHH